MSVQRTGDWARLGRLLAEGPVKLRRAIEVSVRQEAHALRNEIVQGITNQAPGGDPIKALGALTLAAREMKRFKGTKALLVRADLRNGIAVIAEGDRAFVGIPRSAKSRDGTSLVSIAEVQEFGSDPIVIPMTPRMRRFLFALYKKAGRPHQGGTGRGVVVVQVPARPFIRPAVNKFRVGLERRFLARVASHMGWGGPAT